MQQFLSTINLFLSPAYSVPAFQNVTGPTGPPLAAPGFAVAPPPTGGPLEGPRGFVGGGGDVSSLGRPDTFARPSGVFGLTGGTGPDGCEGCTGMIAPFGPSDYNQIVSAKEAIAEGLRGNVANILGRPGATGDFYAEVAQEALYQQMLVSLSSAYTVDAIVQYPVDVRTPFITPPPGATGVYPPRTSGKVVPDLYVIPPPPTIPVEPPPDSIASVARHYEVSAAFFAFAMIHFFRPSTSLPMSSSKTKSACSASSRVTRFSVRVAGLSVVSQSWSAFISPSPL
jgi:hypothetical protein